MKPSLSSLDRKLQWTLLAVLSVVFAGILEMAGLPAALLIGPMIAGILVGSNNGTVRVPRPLYFGAQATISCLIAKGITPSTFGTILDDGLLFIVVITAILTASATLGWLLTRWEVFPGTTAIWSCWPGAASAMILMAESYGADARLVAFMQYLRVVLVAITASLVASLWIDTSAAPSVEIIWFPPINWVGFAETLALACLGTVIGIWGRIPAGGFIVPLFLGAFLNATGLIHIELPPWLLALSFGLVGWNIGLGFTRKTLAHAWRVLPQALASVIALIMICGTIAYLLHVFAGIDPLTAYLATSPGGADSVAIIAASTNVDLPFVLAMQTMRFMIVLLLGPHLARFIAQRRNGSADPPSAPLD